MMFTVGDWNPLESSLFKKRVSVRAYPLPLNAAPVKTRTSNLLIRSQMLYPIELRVLGLAKRGQRLNPTGIIYPRFALPSTAKKESASSDSPKDAQVTTESLPGTPQSNPSGYKRCISIQRCYFFVDRVLWSAATFLGWGRSFTVANHLLRGKGSNVCSKISKAPQKAQPARPARLATIVNNSAGSTGFVTCIWKPANTAFIRSSERAYAVKATAGMPPPRSAGSARTCRISA